MGSKLSQAWEKVVASGDSNQIEAFMNQVRALMESNRQQRMSEGYTPCGIVALTYAMQEVELKIPEKQSFGEVKLKLLDEYLVKYNLTQYRKAEEIQVGDAIVLKYSLRKGGKEYMESYDVLGNYGKDLFVRYTCMHTSDSDRRIPIPTARNFVLGIRCNDKALPTTPKQTKKPKHFFFIYQ